MLWIVSGEPEWEERIRRSQSLIPQVGRFPRAGPIPRVGPIPRAGPIPETPWTQNRLQRVHSGPRGLVEKVGVLIYCED